MQKCAPEWANVPHWQQNRPPAGTATTLCGLYGSAVRAQIRAITQPITVHPRKRFTRMIPAASRLSRPMMVGRKYRKTRKSRVSTGHPFHFDLGATDTPARLLPLIRMRLPKCFRPLGGSSHSSSGLPRRSLTAGVNGRTTGSGVSSVFRWSAMSVILDSQFATVEDTAAILGVSEARLKRLLRLAGPKETAGHAKLRTSSKTRTNGKLKRASSGAIRKKQSRGKAKKAAH